MCVCVCVHRPFIVSEVKRQRDLLPRGNVLQRKHTKVEIVAHKEVSQLSRERKG